MKMAKGMNAASSTIVVPNIICTGLAVSAPSAICAAPKAKAIAAAGLANMSAREISMKRREYRLEPSHVRVAIITEIGRAHV